MNDSLTHLDSSGRARMVDVSTNEVTERVAKARGRVTMDRRTLELVIAGDVPKGDVLTVARIAGIMAAKKTSEIIPLCHPLGLTSASVVLEPDAQHSAITITATCKVTGRTGVEMEALTAVSAAALTVYDMLKAVDRHMTIDGVRLIEKSGGRSGDRRHDQR